MVSLWHICCLVYTPSSVYEIYFTLEYSGLVKLFLANNESKGHKALQEISTVPGTEGLLLPAKIVQYQLPWCL